MKYCSPLILLAFILPPLSICAQELPRPVPAFEFLGPPALPPTLIPAPPAPSEITFEPEDWEFWEQWDNLNNWKGGVELGITGNEGNTRNFKTRLGTGLKRETFDWILLLDTIYGLSYARGVQTENFLLSKGRYEYLFQDSNWSLFTSGTVEYDEFKAFNVRLSGHTGFGYTLVKNDWTLLKHRLGAGASREIGSPSNEFKPELLYGVDFEQKISDAQQLCSTLEYIPNVTDWGDYRIEARASYEILVDPTWNLKLKFGIIDRYNNRAQGKKPNDLEYFFTMLWKF